MPRLGRAAIALLVVLLASLPAIAADRFALVIGNQAYNNAVGPLRNPHNDIALVGKSLTDVGFKLLSPRKDATRDDMLFAVHELAAQAGKRDAVTFLYYAGHGVAVGSENVLIPTNAENTTDAMLSVRGVRLSEILDILRRDAPEAVHFVVVDACRNTLRGQRGARGFVPVNDRRTGVVVAFSTAQGETASDDGTTNAPYAISLAEELIKPGRNDLEVFSAVRLRVFKATNGQTPWTHDGLIGERVVFKAAPPAQPQVQQSDAEIRLLKEQLAQLQSDLKQQQERMGANTDREKALKEALEKSQSGLKKREDEQEKKQQVAVAAPSAAKASEKKQAVQVTPSPSLNPVTVLRDCPDCPEMVVVPAGTFVMGARYNAIEWSDATPQHDVTVSRPFAVGRYEVTFAEWDRCVTDGGCKHSPSDERWGRDKRPVIDVSWNDITNEYLRWLKQKTNKTYRLLTEAEWEYVARAGTRTVFSTGTTITTSQANFNGSYSDEVTPKGLFRAQTIEVGSFQPNAFGLFDVHGNVAEWVQDCYASNYASAPLDGRAVDGIPGCRRVVRGGSWMWGSYSIASAHRHSIDGNHRSNFVGFRLAKTLD